MWYRASVWLMPNEDMTFRTRIRRTPSAPGRAPTPGLVIAFAARFRLYSGCSWILPRPRPIIPG